MNRELLNNQVSRLPIAMAGIVHGYIVDGIRLSSYTHTNSQFKKRFLP